MREFGPAAIEDLIPRLRTLAAVLDNAHAAGFVHGRLHPSKVIVTDDDTFLLGRPVRATETLTADRDQLALAGIAYEWMFGRPAAGPSDRPIAVRAIPGIDRGALSQAFTRAMSPDPANRFASCIAFVNAVTATAIPSLPFAGGAVQDDDEDPVGPFMPESAAMNPVDPFVPESAAMNPVESAPPLDVIDPMIAAPDFDAPIGRGVVTDMPTRHHTDPDLGVPAAFASTSAALPSSFGVPTKNRERFSGLALILAASVGMVAGFAAGYMAKPRALQQGTAVTDGSTGATGATTRPDASMAESRRSSSDPERAKTDGTVEKGATGATGAPSARESAIGRLLVRSTPPGASVEVDGVARGVTPLALRDLDLGSRQISVSRRGYVPEQARVVLTKARPSRSVEFTLDAQAAPAPAAGAAGSRARENAPPRPATPATLGKPAVTTGTLAVDSLPSGAAVTVNGKPSGTTPLTINDLQPGEYRVTLALRGYREFATTVRVVAGERARAAARLTEQEQE